MTNERVAVRSKSTTNESLIMQHVPFDNHVHKIFLIDYRLLTDNRSRSYLTWSHSRSGAEALTRSMEGKNAIKIFKITPFDLNEMN